MPVTIEERVDSPTIGNDYAERKYNIHGTSDEYEAYNQLATDAPVATNYMCRSRLQVEPVRQDTTDGSSIEGLWLGTVTYAFLQVTPSDPAEGPVLSFDTTGGTQHITQSLSTVGKYAPSGKTATDHGGAIGVAGGNVEGVDITVPAYTWTETYQFNDSQVTFVYRSTLAALTGRVNNASWKGLAAGEGLFLGASGSKRGSEKWEITFRFASQANETNLTVGAVTGINKKGWEYMWVEYEDYGDDTAHALGKKVKAVFIEQVYRSGNFANLGIGT